MSVHMGVSSHVRIVSSSSKLNECSMRYSVHLDARRREIVAKHGQEPHQIGRADHAVLVRFFDVRCVDFDRGLGGKVGHWD